MGNYRKLLMPFLIFLGAVVYQFFGIGDPEAGTIFGQTYDQIAAMVIAIANIFGVWKAENDPTPAPDA